MFNEHQTVLVVGAHPDDEVLGAGGAIARHSDAGQDVYVLIVTEGTTQQYDSDEIIKRKKKETQRCADILGVTDVYFGDLPDMRLDSLDHVTINSVIEEVCHEITPDIVYTHSRREMNKDHVMVHDSTLVATRPDSNVSKVLAYETPSSTEYAPVTDGFTPELFIDITDYVDTKINAFNAYKTETRTYPHPRSDRYLRALSMIRGAASGTDAAEAFDVLRIYE